MRLLVLLSIALLRKCGLFRPDLSAAPSIFHMSAAVGRMLNSTTPLIQNITVLEEFLTWCPNQQCHNCSAKLPINSWIYSLSDGTSACERCKPPGVHWIGGEELGDGSERSCRQEGCQQG